MLRLNGSEKAAFRLLFYWVHLNKRPFEQFGQFGQIAD
jgi:hypothetical protein